MIPPSKKGLGKPFIDTSFHLYPWEEVVATCIDTKTNQTETIIVLKFTTKQIDLLIKNDQISQDIIGEIKGKEIAILRTENSFIIREIIDKQIPKN